MGERGEGKGRCRDEWGRGRGRRSGGGKGAGMREVGTYIKKDVTLRDRTASQFHTFLSQIAAACEFYMYIGHIQKGILKLDDRK